ncbi:MAG: hypothetical protein N2515_06285 [Deltaproteobacteria bacterium]|nr:hypothetical protein [Deltaproteobacteria bacterium]
MAIAAVDWIRLPGHRVDAITTASWPEAIAPHLVAPSGVTMIPIARFPRVAEAAIALHQAKR